MYPIRCKRKHQTFIFQHIVVVVCCQTGALCLYDVCIQHYDYFIFRIMNVCCICAMKPISNCVVCKISCFSIIPSSYRVVVVGAFLIHNKKSRQLFKGLSKKIWFLIPDMARVNFLILFLHAKRSDEGKGGRALCACCVQ